MHENTKEFLTKLAALMEEYDVDIEIVESSHLYNGYKIDGIEVGVSYEDFDDEAYFPAVDYVSLEGRVFTCKEVKDRTEQE